MKKKKLIGIFAAFCLSACLITACGGGNSDLTESSSATETQTTSSQDKKDDSKTNGSEAQKETAETDQEETNNEETNAKETVNTTEPQKQTDSNNSSPGNTTSAKKSSGNSGTASTPKTSGSSSSQNKSSSSGNSSNSGSSSSVSSGSSSKPAAHTHNFKVVSETAATCTSNGVRTYKCSCGQTKTKTIASALGHKWVKKTHTETIPAQTHTEYATKIICGGCGAQFDSTQAAGEHIAMDFWDNCENYSERKVAIGTVIDVPQHTVEVTDYTYCSRCNARQ